MYSHYFIEKFLHQIRESLSKHLPKEAKEKELNKLAQEILSKLLEKKE